MLCFLKLQTHQTLKMTRKLKLLKPFLNSPSEFQPIASELEILYLIENKKFKNCKN